MHKHPRYPQAHICRDLCPSEHVHTWVPYAHSTSRSFSLNDILWPQQPISPGRFPAYWTPDPCGWTYRPFLVFSDFSLLEDNVSVNVHPAHTFFMLAFLLYFSFLILK